MSVLLRSWLLVLFTESVLLALFSPAMTRYVSCAHEVNISTTFHRQGTSLYVWDAPKAAILIFLALQLARHAILMNILLH